MKNNNQSYREWEGYFYWRHGFFGSNNLFVVVGDMSVKKIRNK